MAATYTVKVTDRFLRFDTANDDVVVTLLPFEQTPNAPYEIQKISSGDGNTVTIQVDPSTTDFLLPDGSTSLTLDDTNHTVFVKIPASGLSPAYVTSGSGGGGNGGGGGGGAAPPVTIDPVADLIFRNNHKIEIDVTWTPAATATPANFSGVAAYLEDPDISSGTQTPLDASVVLDGSAQVSGNWAPERETDSFVQAGAASGVAVVFPDSTTTYTQSRNVRIYLAAFGPGSSPALVRANQPGATPSIMVEVPIGPDQGQSGMEWAFLVGNVHVDVKTDYNRPDPKYYLVFTYDPPDPSVPVPPGVNRFGGVRIVYVYYDSSGNPIFPGTDTGISVPADQSQTGYKSSVYDANPIGGKFLVYFCSEDDSQPLGKHVNSLVDGVTPRFEVTVPAIPNNLLDVGNLTISDEKVSWQLDNTLVAQATFAWTLPDASVSGNRYAGVRLYLVNVAKDTGNDGLNLSSFPFPLSDTQANVDTGYTVYETPPAKPEIWTVAAISVNSNGGLADIPENFGKPSFHSPTVLWHVGNLPSVGGAALVTVNPGATAVATQALSADGVGMVSFQVGPWTNPTDASFGGVQVALVINNDTGHPIFWQVPNGATSFATPPMPSFGNINANVPVDFYLVSDDPQGKKNRLEPGGNSTPKIGSTYVPKAGAIIPARSGWFSSEFSWPDGGSFQAVSFSAQKIFVGSQLVVGGAPSSFNGPNGQNGQIAVKSGTGKLVAWMGQSEPNLGQGQGPAGVYGGWFGQIYVGGTNPLDAPIYVDNNGIIQVGGISPAQNSSAYPYISIRNDTGLEVGRIGAKLNAPAPTGSSGVQGGVGPSPPAITTGAWFNQLAVGGSNLSNWNVLITPTTTGNPLGSDFLMRNIQLLSVDYPQMFGSPAMQQYKLDFGNSVWMAGGLSGGWQFPGIHIYEVDNSGNNFGATFLNRGMVLRGHSAQAYHVLCSLATWNGLQSGADGPPFNFWADLSMYSPTSPYNQTVALSSGANNGSASFALRDFNGFTLFNVDATGNTQVAGVLSGVPDRSTGAAKPVNAYAYKVAGYTTGDGTVIDNTGKWVGPPISVAGNQTPWTQHISAQGFGLLGAGEVHGTTFFLGGATLGAGTQVVNSSGTFVGNGVDVQNGALYCGFLSTIQHPGGSGEIDCGLIKCNNNIIVTQGAVDISKISGKGWVAADVVAGQNSLATNGQIFVNSQVVINSSGQFVSPGGVDVGGAGIGCAYLRTRGRTDSDTVYSIGAFYYGENVRLPNGVVVIDQSRNFFGSSLNVGGGNVTCGSANVSGQMTCGSFSLQGLMSVNQIAVQCSPVDAVTATLVGYGQFRAVYGGYGAFIRNDGGNFYLLVTAANDPNGIWNGLRPFLFNLASGDVTMSHNVNVGGNLGIGGAFNASNLSTAAGGICSAGNFNIVGGQANPGLVIDGSRNVLFNTLYNMYWGGYGGQPIINNSGMFTGAGVQTYNNGPVTCGQINAQNMNISGINCSSLNMQGGSIYNIGSISLSGLTLSGNLSVSGQVNVQQSFYINGTIFCYSDVQASYAVRCNALYVNGMGCVLSNGIWSGGGVQCNQYVLASTFGIYNVAFGWPGAGAGTGTIYYKDWSGNNRYMNVNGGLIIGVG